MCTCSKHVIVGFPQWLIKLNKSFCQLSHTLRSESLIRISKLAGISFFQSDSTSRRRVVACSWQHPDTLSMQTCYLGIHTRNKKQFTELLLRSQSVRNSSPKTVIFQRFERRVKNRKAVLIFMKLSFIYLSFINEYGILKMCFFVRLIFKH